MELRNRTKQISESGNFHRTPPCSSLINCNLRALAHTHMSHHIVCSWFAVITLIEKTWNPSTAHPCVLAKTINCCQFFPSECSPQVTKQLLCLVWVLAKPVERKKLILHKHTELGFEWITSDLFQMVFRFRALVSWENVTTDGLGWGLSSSHERDWLSYVYMYWLLTVGKGFVAFACTWCTSREGNWGKDFNCRGKLKPQLRRWHNFPLC